MKNGYGIEKKRFPLAHGIKVENGGGVKTKTLSNVRGIGMIAAADINKNLYSSDKMKNMIRFALQNGALLRPLGRTVYWLPPLNIEKHTIDELKEATKNALVYAFKQNTIRI